MNAVAIKKGQTREKAEGFREMGALRTVAARNRGALSNKRIGSKRSSPRNTKGIRNTTTGSNCRGSLDRL